MVRGFNFDHDSWMIEISSVFQWSNLKKLSFGQLMKLHDYFEVISQRYSFALSYHRTPVCLTRSDGSSLASVWASSIPAFFPKPRQKFYFPLVQNKLESLNIPAESSCLEGGVPGGRWRLRRLHGVLPVLRHEQTPTVGRPVEGYAAEKKTDIIESAHWWSDCEYRII